ncbi:MAG: hypothetical protein IJ748_02180, partial [Bacteroidales bacterium]|nr:hypothetical protein [Bacteroidales bacterium]
HNMQDENGREAEYVVELNSDEGILGTVTGKREEKGETVFEFTDSFGRKGEITYGELQKMNTEGDLPLIATKTDDILNYLKGQAEGDAEMQKRIEKRRSWINSAQRDEDGRLYVETGTVNIEGEDKEVLIKARNEETGTAIIEAEGKTVQVSTEEIRDVRRRGFEESEENVSERVVLDIADTEKEDFEGYMRNAYGKEEDKQGNPTTENGKLIIEDVKSIDEISDRDFEEPYRNVGLPVLPTEVQNVLGIKGRKVIIKKNIFERNKLRHQDLSPENSREILREALYNTDLYGQNQKKKRPYNWVVINTKDASGDNRIVLLEIREDKENVEIVHWHYLDDRSVEKIRRQAEREGGQLLILPSENTEEAGALSSRTSDLSSESKDNTKVGNSEEKRLPFENKRSLLNELPADGSTAINPTNESSRQTPDISALDNSEGKDSTKDGNGEGKRSKNIKVADEIAKLRKREEEKSIQQIQEREEISEGVFGNIYNQFKGKVKEAIDFLLNNKEGIAKEVLHHKDIKGGIDLVYGTDTYGLKKIAKKHPEVLENLQEILDNMSIVSSSDNRIVLESATHKAVISKKIGDIDTDNWLLTAYEKKKGNETSASSSDIETEPEITGKRNGTATSQNSTSSGKDSTNSGNESN